MSIETIEQAKRMEPAEGTLFKQGDRVVIVSDHGHHNDVRGRHGEIVDVSVIRWTSIAYGTGAKVGSDRDVYYKVRTDAGAHVDTLKCTDIENEIGEAPVVVPDPVWDGRPATPDRIMRAYHYSRRREAEHYARSLRRRVKSKANEDNAAALREREESITAHARWWAWANEHPYEAEKWTAKYPNDTIPVVYGAVKRAAVTPVDGGGSVVGASWRINTEKDGVEIKFADKPDAGVLTRIKSAGWRWSRFGGCWYTRKTDEAIAFAESVCGSTAVAMART